jgi:GDP-L-fucose synthase
MQNYDSPEIINVGVGEDLSITELATLVSRIIGFAGTVAYDRSKPDGTPRKLLDVSRLHASGWHARTSLEDGIRKTYEWFCANFESVAG